jgi:hypothetical protein
VLALAVIAGPVQDELWLAVERTIDGAMHRSIEVLQPAFEPTDGSNADTIFFVDCGLALDSPGTCDLTLSDVTATDARITAVAPVFDVGDVGREIRFRYRADGAWRLARMEIVAVVSATEVETRIVAPLPAADTVLAGAWRMTVTAVSGLDHLEGETVQILADGATHADKTVAGGSVAFDRKVASAQIGLPYRSLLETLSLESGALDGTAQSKEKRINRVAVRLLDSLGCRVGRDQSLDEVLFRSGADAMDEGPPLFTGEKIVEFPVGWDRELTVVVAQDMPLPCTVTGIVPRLTANGG